MAVGSPGFLKIQTFKSRLDPDRHPYGYRSDSLNCLGETTIF